VLLCLGFAHYLVKRTNNSKNNRKKQQQKQNNNILSNYMPELVCPGVNLQI